LLAVLLAEPIFDRSICRCHCHMATPILCSRNSE
jgi:hypothetical protein